MKDIITIRRIIDWYERSIAPRLRGAEYQAVQEALKLAGGDVLLMHSICHYRGEGRCPDRIGVLVLTSSSLVFYSPPVKALSVRNIGRPSKEMVITRSAIRKITQEPGEALDWVLRAYNTSPMSIVVSVEAEEQFRFHVKNPENWVRELRT
jgi:hypothetical protein